MMAISQSKDRGSTWKPFCVYGPPSDRGRDVNMPVTMSMVINKEQDGRAISVGTADALYKTMDEGITWGLVGRIKTDAPTGSLRLVPK